MISKSLLTIGNVFNQTDLKDRIVKTELSEVIHNNNNNKLFEKRRIGLKYKKKPEKKLQNQNDFLPNSNHYDKGTLNIKPKIFENTNVSLNWLKDKLITNFQKQSDPHQTNRLNLMSLRENSISSFHGGDNLSDRSNKYQSQSPNKKTKSKQFLDQLPVSSTQKDNMYNKVPVIIMKNDKNNNKDKQSQQSNQKYLNPRITASNDNLWKVDPLQAYLENSENVKKNIKYIKQNMLKDCFDTKKHLGKNSKPENSNIVLNKRIKENKKKMEQGCNTKDPLITYLSRELNDQFSQAPNQRSSSTEKNSSNFNNLLSKGNDSVGSSALIRSRNDSRFMKSVSVSLNTNEMRDNKHENIDFSKRFNKMSFKEKKKVITPGEKILSKNMSKDNKNEYGDVSRLDCIKEDSRKEISRKSNSLGNRLRNQPQVETNNSNNQFVYSKRDSIRRSVQFNNSAQIQNYNFNIVQDSGRESRPRISTTNHANPEPDIEDRHNKYIVGNDNRERLDTVNSENFKKNGKKIYQRKTSIMGLESVTINTAAFEEKNAQAFSLEPKFCVEKMKQNKQIMLKKLQFENQKQKLHADEEYSKHIKQSMLQKSGTYSVGQNVPYETQKQYTEVYEEKIQGIKKFIIMEDDDSEVCNAKCMTDPKTAVGLSINAFSTLLTNLGFIELTPNMLVDFPWISDCVRLAESIYSNLYDFYQIFYQNFNILCEKLYEIIEDISYDTCNTLYDLLLADYNLALPFSAFSVNYFFESMLMIKKIKTFSRKNVYNIYVNHTSEEHVKLIIARQHNHEYYKHNSESFKQYFGRLAHVQRSNDCLKKNDTQKTMVKNRDFRELQVNLKCCEDIRLFNKLLCDFMGGYKHKNYMNTINKGIKMKEEINYKRHQKFQQEGKKKFGDIERFRKATEGDLVTDEILARNQKKVDVIRLYEENEVNINTKMNLSRYLRTLNKNMRAATSRLDYNLRNDK